MNNKFNVGDWVLIADGKKAHRLVQGYNTLTVSCTSKIHRLGMSFCADVEQEETVDGSNSAKCKRCLSKLR